MPFNKEAVVAVAAEPTAEDYANAEPLVDEEEWRNTPVDAPPASTGSIYDLPTYGGNYPHDLRMATERSTWPPPDGYNIGDFAVVGRKSENDERPVQLSELLSEAVVVPTDKDFGWREYTATFQGQERTTKKSQFYCVVLDPLDEPEICRVTLNWNGEAGNVVREFAAACPPEKRGTQAIGIRTRAATARNGARFRVWSFAPVHMLQAVDVWTPDDDKTAVQLAHEAIESSEWSADFLGAVFPRS